MVMMVVLTVMMVVEVPMAMRVVVLVGDDGSGCTYGSCTTWHLVGLSLTKM